MLIIVKEKIEELLKELAKKQTVIDTRRDNLPVKQYFLPPREETFAIDKNKGKILKKKKEKPFIVFGLGLRDAEALTQLDEIMKNDFFYFQKRENITIISIINEDGAIFHAGIDLILERTNENEYKAMPLTEKGRKISKHKYFQEKEANFLEKEKSATMPELRKLLLDPELLKDAIEWSWKNYPEIWERLGKQCLGCGICAYVCPLCHCFSTNDKCSFDGEKCTRERQWTACTLPEFSRIADNHKFHKTIKERYYNWFYHKFVRAYKEFGKAQCVACGRCQEQCPARIDIEKTLIDIVKKYEESLLSQTS